MRKKIIEHICSIAFVSLVLILILILFKQQDSRNNSFLINTELNLGELSFVDFSSSFHRALLKDVVNIYYPGQYEKNNNIVELIFSKKESDLNKKLNRAFTQETLSVKKIGTLLIMYLKFFIVYVIVMILTYYGVQTIAAWRFCRKKQIKLGQSRKISRIFSMVFSKIAKTVLYFILFSPAYVIAYSIRTEFNTDTIFFMAILAVISNGLLVTYQNKFYAFLVSESKKGYVETAIVKNLNNSYEFNTTEGIYISSLLKPVKKFKGHVFDHIFSNAKHQYLTTIKEQAAFLITGLIIIEMALNIHGHLSYEMLRQLLYKNYDIVIAIILGIFYTVKATEIFVDFLVYKAEKRLENI